jgi:hypothetical protein
MSVRAWSFCGLPACFLRLFRAGSGISAVPARFLVSVRAYSFRVLPAHVAWLFCAVSGFIPEEARLLVSVRACSFRILPAHVAPKFRELASPLHHAGRDCGAHIALAATSARLEGVCQVTLIADSVAITKPAVLQF